MLYREKQLQEMSPWDENTIMDGVSISDADIKNGSPKAGDMIATSAKDIGDMWLVAKEFFDENYELVKTA